MSAETLACPPPDPNPRPPGFKVPANACDCHAHVIGPAQKYPFVADRSYTPPDALLGDYVHVLKTLGIGRAVLVQPSMHGADNTAMMEAIAAAKSIDMRAVVVVPPDVKDDELWSLHRAGARGVRLNMIYSGGGINLDMAAEIEDRIRDHGWHLQFLVDVSKIGPDMNRFARLKIPIVFDHMGHLSAAHGIRDAGFQALLELLKRGNTWVKLSGAYRLTTTEYPYPDVRPFVETLLRTQPERLVWGTDWPHTVCQVRMPNDGELMDLLREWIPEDGILHKVLVDNPAALYGFA
jgi:predicted TIM-barrel fold metal-dependent hydrolase